MKTVIWMCYGWNSAFTKGLYELISLSYISFRFLVILFLHGLIFLKHIFCTVIIWDLLLERHPPGTYDQTTLPAHPNFGCFFRVVKIWIITTRNSGICFQNTRKLAPENAPLKRSRKRPSAGVFGCPFSGVFTDFEFQAPEIRGFSTRSSGAPAGS